MAHRSAKRATVSPAIDTISELAKLVDRDVGTVSRWTRRDDWPFPKKPPFQRSAVPKILRWVADTLIQREGNGGTGGDADDADPDGMPALKKEKLRKEIRKLHAQADAAETALARERGALVDAAEVEREWTSIGVLLRNAFQNLGAQLVPVALTHGMPHEAAAQFQEQADGAVAGILRRLSEGAKNE